MAAQVRHVPPGRTSWAGVPAHTRHLPAQAAPLRLSSPPPPPPPPPGNLPIIHASWALWWLHFPKCGTSLRASVIDFPWSKDRDLSWPAGNHQVLFPDIAGRIDTPDVRVVAMFRQPEERLLSAYFHMRDHIPKARMPQQRKVARAASGNILGCCWDDWGWPRGIYTPVHRMVARGDPPEVAISQFVGCQTSMVLGKGCMSRYANSPEHVAQAIGLVGRFQFVGDVAHWNLSMCLFNKILTGRRFTLHHQLLNSRPTTHKLLPFHVRPNATAAEAEAAHRRAAAASTLRTADPIDGALYAYVQYRFWHDVRAHGISSECCPAYETAQSVPADEPLPHRCRITPLPPPPPQPHHAAAAAAPHSRGGRGGRGGGRGGRAVGQASAMMRAGGAAAGSAAARSTAAQLAWQRRYQTAARPGAPQAARPAQRPRRLRLAGGQALPPEG